jgi:hypothetical protein
MSPVSSDTLSSLASDYAQGMTSIRGRRVQRLLNREFAGLEHVLLVQTGSGMEAVLGLSTTGAAFCATDGTGKQATVVRWNFASPDALENAFDLLKDSLPVVGARSVSRAELRQRIQVRVPSGAVPPRARKALAFALQALA